jgi:uncharacterized damage-inducible protein DinB
VDIPQMYDYLVRARRELWTALGAVPDELLSRALLTGDRFHCIKDLLFHVPAVEDGWIHEDILRVDPIWVSHPAVKDTDGGPSIAAVPLASLLDYWATVERSTLSYLATLSEGERSRVVSLHDSPDEKYKVDGLLWHVMTHEMRHTAQICVLLRSQGIKPPSLDLLFFLPAAR